jgi:hypothetical protein
MNSVSLTQLDQIGWTIERRGIAGVPDQVIAQIADDAVRLGVRPVSAGVLANPADPAAARERAFGRIAPALAKTSPADIPGRLSRVG